MTAWPPIAVTGLGATTPLGGTVATTWEGVLRGRSGTTLLDGPQFAALPTRLAAPAAVDPATLLEPAQARRLDRAQQLALVAAREAWRDAGSPEVAPERLAVVVGCGIGGVITLLNAQEMLRGSGSRRISPHTIPMLIPNGPAAAVGLELGARGGVLAPVSACASGAEAIAVAVDLLRLDRADVVVCGGTEAAIHPLPLAGFAALRALSRREDDPPGASRPFDKGRDGFVLGEGAGMLVLERPEQAQVRRAFVHGFIAGAGVTSDAFHTTAPDPTGAGAARAVARALEEGGVEPAEIRHVNVHATGTPVGDLTEIAALRLALGSALDAVAVSATKSCTGHLLGAAGAVEAVLTVLALRERLAPPTRNLDDPDDGLDADVVVLAPRALPRQAAALSTSFGFGGHDVALAFRSAG